MAHDHVPASGACTEGGPAPGQSQSMRRVMSASLSGAALEWYDFNLYGLSAALVFGKLFFPDVNPVLGTLASLATFGVGFVLRPLGALLFGHLGDRAGRKKSLVATMLLIGSGTFLIGLLPGYRTIGVWAPVLLVLLRLVQGIGLGGEWAGASLLAVEHAPRSRRGLWGSVPQTGAPLGYLLAIGFTGLFTLLPEGEFLAWGWRVPFLLSAALTGVGLLVRRKIAETPDFRRAGSEGVRERAPSAATLRTYPRTTALAFGARLGEACSSQVYQPFVIAYATGTLGYPRYVALTGVVFYNVLALLLMPVAGAVSDRVGRRPPYLVGSAFVALSALPYFVLIDSGSTAAAWTAMTLAALGGSVCMSSVQGAFFTELFGVRVRYSALGIASQASAMVAGFVPACAAAMVAGAGSSWPAGVLLAAVGAVSFVSAWFLSETGGHRHTGAAAGLRTTEPPPPPAGDAGSPGSEGTGAGTGPGEAMG